MNWFRVDNRMVHGQVIEAWLPYLDARQLIVVNDALAMDALQQQIMQLAIPGRINVQFIPVNDAKGLHNQLEKEGTPTLFLAANCQDVVRMVEQGISVPTLNIGNMHYARGKRQICAHVAISDDDQCCLEYLKQLGTIFDFRCVPSDVPAVEGW